MSALEASEQIVVRLSHFWQFHKKQAFANYLQETFGYPCSTSPVFDCLYIAQIENGNVDEGAIGGILVQWWSVNDHGVRKISNPELPIALNEPENLRRGFYPTPILKFFLDGDRIVFGESFGPNCICRKVAQVQLLGNGEIQFANEKIVWKA